MAGFLFNIQLVDGRTGEKVYPVVIVTSLVNIPISNIFILLHMICSLFHLVLTFLPYLVIASAMQLESSQLQITLAAKCAGAPVDNF